MKGSANHAAGMFPLPTRKGSSGYWGEVLDLVFEEPRESKFVCPRTRRYQIWVSAMAQLKAAWDAGRRTFADDETLIDLLKRLAQFSRTLIDVRRAYTLTVERPRIGSSSSTTKA